ncbi:MAG: DegV family protein [Clostridia bacterium]|nr:DegV family protein [Clostridia bacterium]NCC68494.1 DegV family protein [Clostridia bacterium]
MSVKIITDSGSDILGTEMKNITVMPLKVTFDNEDYLDGVTLSHNQFYEKLIESDVIPKTSQVSPYEFETAFREVAEAGDTAVVITLSKKLSGTWQSAMIAAKDFENSVLIVDSESVSLGEYVLVMYAARLRDAGLSAAEIVEILEEKKKNVCVMALLETLEYLKKGGRIGAAAAFAGGLLSIRPVVSAEDGEIVVLGKARGSKKGNNLLVQIIEQKNGIDFDMPLMLGYTGLSDAVLQKYIADSEKLWAGNLDTLPITSIGGTIGTYAGPGAVAVAFFHK